MAEQRSNKCTAVIGAGIVGVSTALWLQRDGRQVILIDRLEPGEATSFGNAGVIACCSIVPVTVPGLWSKAPGMLMDRDSPLFLRWRYLPRLLPWLLPYLGRCTPEKTAHAARYLAPLVCDGLEQHKVLSQGTGAERWLVESDYLFAYRDRSVYEADAFGWSLRRDGDISWRELDGPALREFEPMLGPETGFGVLMSGHGFVRDPGAYVKALAERFAADGGTVHRGAVTGFRFDGDTLQAVETESGFLEASCVVIAAGAWSAQLTKLLGVETPLESERGYHIVLRNPSAVPRCPIMVTSGKFVATPMDTGLRCAGVIEFGGLQAPPSPAPWAMLKNQVRRTFPDLTYDETSEWMGHRPAPIDSLPFLGEVPGRKGVFCAFGHHHIGLTAGPKTGRLVADLIAGRRPNLDFEPYRVNRFA